MKERPIIFSGPMVRAILESRKTVTRRVVKLSEVANCVHLWKDGRWEFGCTYGDGDGEATEVLACPYGQSGDLLWVRETWGYRGSRWSSSSPDLETIFLEYRADCEKRDFTAPRDAGAFPGLPSQRPAEGMELVEGSDEWFEYQDYLSRWWKSWRPSIHMPKWACRLWLRVEDVRVERLKDITEEDAKAEGVDSYDLSGLSRDDLFLLDAPLLDPTTPYRNGFALAWDGMHRDRAPWSSNPWTWVVTFSKISEDKQP